MWWAFVVLTLALLSPPGFFPTAAHDGGALAQEEPAAASPAEPASAVVATPTSVSAPTSEPSDTSTPAESPTTTPTTLPTPVPTETSAPTAVPSPTGTAAAAAQSPAVPSPAAAAEGTQARKPRSATTDGRTDISPNHSQRAVPGATITYLHTVTNKGRGTDAKNITATSSHRWTIELLDADGATTLTDHNGDGIPDTGRLAPGQKTRIVVRVTVPTTAPVGVKDKTIVTAASALFRNRTSQDAASDRTTVTRGLVLEVGTTEVDFGQIAADGRLEGAAPGVTSQVDDRGAYYVKERAIRVVVTANVPWTGSCAATENSGTATGITIAGGRLQWRLSGTTDWTPFPSINSRSAQSCFNRRAFGTNTYVYDVRLRVEQTDAPGAFRSTLTFAAST